MIFFHASRPSEDERSGHRADERHAQRGHWHLANPWFYGEPSRRYHNVSYTTRDMHNVNAKQQREGGLDAELCLSTGQIDYQVFGDVVAFDATYKKNVYLSPLVVFSDVNHHNQTVVFAAALVVDEKEETYVWLLQQLQTSMKEKAPVSIIADDDRQIKSVIEQVFLEAHHRLCAWHLLQNTTSNIGKPKFTKMFRDCMLGDYEVGTFQRKWFEIVEKFGVADKRWVQDMCEGLHVVISRYVKSRYSYTNFLRHFHRCLMFVCAKEVDANFECAKGDPVMTTNLKQLEQSAAENYTQVIFYLFVPILDMACTMRVVDPEDNVSYFIHIVSRYGTPGKDWHVVATSDMSEVRCTCMRMECFGVPCEHIIAVLVLNNVHEIPRSLILPKWTKDAKLVVVQSMGMIWDSVQLTCRDTNFPHEGPPTEGGRAPARNTKGNGANGGKKTQRCRLCGVLGHNRTTCLHRRTMESSSAVADDLDSMDIDMLYDNLSWDLYAIMEIPSFRCSDSDMQAGFVNIASCQIGRPASPTGQPQQKISACHSLLPKLANRSAIDRKAEYDKIVIIQSTQVQNLHTRILLVDKLQGVGLPSGAVIIVVSAVRPWLLFGFDELSSDEVTMLKGKMLFFVMSWLQSIPPCRVVCIVAPLRRYSPPVTPVYLFPESAEEACGLGTLWHLFHAVHV
ncbi:hypothetical protein AHAS_Ahas03G0211000 [Arachis hypogaea]